MLWLVANTLLIIIKGIDTHVKADIYGLIDAGFFGISTY